MANGKLGRALAAGQKWVTLETGGKLPAIVVEHNQRRYFGDVLYIGGPAKLIIVHRNGRVESWLSTRASVQLKQRDPRPIAPEAAAGGDDERLRQRKTRANNVRIFHQAIRQQKKVRLVYRTAKGIQGYTVIPLDVKPGKTDRTKKQRYVWAWSEQRKGPLAFRLDRLLKVETAGGRFNPVVLLKSWPDKQVKWNLPRTWGSETEVVNGNKN